MAQAISRRRRTTETVETAEIVLEQDSWLSNSHHKHLAGVTVSVPQALANAMMAAKMAISPEDAAARAAKAKEDAAAQAAKAKTASSVEHPEDQSSSPGA